MPDPTDPTDRPPPFSPPAPSAWRPPPSSVDLEAAARGVSWQVIAAERRRGKRRGTAARHSHASSSRFAVGGRRR